MKRTPRSLILVLMIAVELCCAGCGSGSRSDLGLVQGTVTMDGSPLPNAQVVFSPQGGRPSTALTDAAGKYNMIYIRNIQGAALGQHSVRIESVPPLPPDPQAATKETLVPQQETIPPKYNATTTLIAEVKPGENIIDFPLESKP